MGKKNNQKRQTARARDRKRPKFEVGDIRVRPKPESEGGGFYYLMFTEHEPGYWSWTELLEIQLKEIYGLQYDTGSKLILPN